MEDYELPSPPMIIKPNSIRKGWSCTNYTNEHEIHNSITKAITAWPRRSFKNLQKDNVLILCFHKLVAIVKAHQIQNHPFS